MAPILRSSRQTDVKIPPPGLRRSPRLTRPAAVKERHSNLTTKHAIRRKNPRIRSYSSRSCKRGVSTNIDSLPDELLFDILSRVPAEDIHEKARFVCWRWKRIVHGYAFAQAHLHRTGSGLLISRGYNDPLMLTQGGGIELSELIKESKSLVYSSCNGLILVAEIFKDYILHVVNPATKCCFELPKFCSKGTRAFFGMAYTSASMKYKVVATYFSKENRMLVQCNVLTVGVDNTWRHVATQQLSPEANKLLYHDPLITEGFMHWASSFGNVFSTLNAETEVFAESRTPLAPPLGEYDIRRSRFHFLSTGRHLSMLRSCGDLLWQVWEMKGGSGEWRKVVPDINLNARKSEIEQLALKDDVILRPIGWVKYPELLLLFPYNKSYYVHKPETEATCIVYNLDRDEIKSVKIPTTISCCLTMVHMKSLVWLS